jgi:phosphoglycolate phosphatase-like HAD superfamily hydrolase
MSDSNLSHVRGLVFDLDGTLVHSTIDFPLMRRLTFERMCQADVPEDILDEQKSITNNLNACYQYLIDKGCENAARSMVSEAGRIMNEIEMRNVRYTLAVSKASEAICRLIDDGYVMAVLTRGSRDYTEAALLAAGLSGYFEKSICRDDYSDEEAKPNPISMTRAARKICMTNEECLLVGDHMMDLECALSAGSDFVGVLSGATDMPTWTSLGVARIIPDISYLPGLLTRT